MSQTERNLALSLASLLLAGKLELFHELSIEADGPVIGRAIDIYAVMLAGSARRMARWS